MRSEGLERKHEGINDKGGDQLQETVRSTFLLGCIYLLCTL